MNSRAKCLLVVLVAVSMIGCSSKTSQSSVSGKVTLDGQPLANGLIDFVAVDRNSPTAQAAVTDGQFAAVVPPGEKRVEIRATKVTGKKKVYDTPDSPTVDVVAELLPPRYNVDSTLTMTVAEGEQEKTFELSSK